jgi:hypothetical protein
VFGYVNVAVDGHVARQVDPAEAAVVRRIFEMAAAGLGTRRIAHALNTEGALAPSPRRASRPWRVIQVAALAAGLAVREMTSLYGTLARATVLDPSVPALPLGTR